MSTSSAKRRNPAPELTALRPFASDSHGTIAAPSHPSASASRETAVHPAATPGLSSSRGQAAIEIMVYVGFFLMVFVVINLFFILQVSQDISQRQYTLSQSSAAQVAEDLQMALSAGPGFSYNFSIPTSISGRSYSVNITNSSSIYVQVEGGPGGAPSRIYFPLGLRSIKLGSCPDCIGNGQWTYSTVSGQPVREIGINASKGWMQVNNTLGADGYPQLVVS